MLACVLLCLLTSNTSDCCANACPFFCICVYGPAVCLSFFCIHECEYVNVVSVHARMHTFTCMGVWTCTWYLVRACKTDSVLWWTLDLLGTRWRRANLAYIVYPRLYVMTEMADRVYSLFCAASRPGKWLLKQTVCLVCSDRLQVQESLQVELFPVCFLGGELKPQHGRQLIISCKILKCKESV